MNASTIFEPFRRAALLLVLSLACSSPSWAREWRIVDFQDAITISEDGTADVVERISAAFSGQFEGIHRTIPVAYPGPRGTNYTLFLDVQSVTDGAGQALRYKSSVSGGFRDLKIFIPNAVDATRIVEIHYIVRNGTRFFPSYDEFYWNVTGNDWEVPIDHASAIVALPADSREPYRAQAYTGAYGSVDRAATARLEGGNASFETAGSLPMRGGLTIDIYIPKGVLRPPSTATRTVWFAKSNPVVAIPVATLALMFALWWFKGRDPDPGRSVAPMYEPPKGMTPAEVGTLIDDRINPRDITSTLVDLAARGYLGIEEISMTGLVFFQDTDYEFKLLNSEWEGLASHEKTMLKRIFSKDNRRKLSSLNGRFYTAIPEMDRGILSALKKKKMYRVLPTTANAYNAMALLFIAALFAAALIAGHMAIVNSPGLIAVCALVSVAIWRLFGRKMSARTMEGARTRIHILGFQEFMDRVDADALKRMPPDTFEKNLGYAMALGVEAGWARAFAGLLKEPPSWYVPLIPHGGFNPVLFSSSMQRMSSNMGGVLYAAPRASSSGSGWSGGGGGFSGGGGGFSGGGFGGGGGRAF